MRPFEVGMFPKRSSSKCLNSQKVDQSKYSTGSHQNFSSENPQLSKSKSFVLFKFDGTEYGGFSGKSKENLVRSIQRNQSLDRISIGEESMERNSIQHQALVKEYFKKFPDEQTRKGAKPDPYNRRFL